MKFKSYLNQISLIINFFKKCKNKYEKKNVYLYTLGKNLSCAKDLRNRLEIFSVTVFFSYKFAYLMTK